MRKVVVIGGSSIEICATSYGSLFQNDSNPGRVEFGLGGVARNVADNLSLLGENVSLLTAIGDDSFGHVALDRSREANIKMLCDPFIGEQTGVLISFADNTGSFFGGVSDMEITHLISPEIIEENLNAILFSDYVMIETNLDEEVIKKIASYDIRLVADGVSGQKCRRMLSSLDRFYLVKMNRIEAINLTGKTTREEIIRTLVSLGVRRCIITKRKDGAMCFEALGNKIYTYDLENMPNQPIDGATNGCSDAFMSGFLYSFMNGSKMDEALYHGQAAARLNLESNLPVNKKMNAEKLEEAVEEFKKTVPIVRAVL